MSCIAFRGTLFAPLFASTPVKLPPCRLVQLVSAQVCRPGKTLFIKMEQAGPGESGNMKDDEGRNNLKHKNLLQPCFVNFPANLSWAPELPLLPLHSTIAVAAVF
ncbi:hypothetical protein AMECASPLE_020709 [Ameca splendens]|uniref:Secreted protein n=1 Tax=Ameca splendens TaxID=208324 RepID=A0ABV0Z1E3_9TELE